MYTRTSRDIENVDILLKLTPRSEVKFIRDSSEVEWNKYLIKD